MARRRGRRPRRCPTRPRTPLPMSSPPFSTPARTRERTTMTEASPHCAGRCGPARTRPRRCSRAAARRTTAPTSTVSSAPACDADRPSAEQLLAEHPDLRDRLTDDDRAAIVEAAGSASVAAVALMLDLGFSPHARNGFGEQPLHSAAYAGNADMVRLLLDAGADVDARDVRFECHAAGLRHRGQRRAAPGDQVTGPRWSGCSSTPAPPETACGSAASRPARRSPTFSAATGSPPTTSPSLEPDDEDGPPSSLGTGVMADIARHLEAAYRDLDLELLGSLLHPEVRWTGVCSNSAAGPRLVPEPPGRRHSGRPSKAWRSTATPSCSGSAWAAEPKGARPAPPELLYQVFTVDNAQVVEIRVYPDRASALTRTCT